METPSKFTKTIAALILAAVPFAFLIGILGLFPNNGSSSTSELHIASTTLADTGSTTSGGYSSISSYHPKAMDIELARFHRMNMQRLKLNPADRYTRPGLTLSTLKNLPHHSFTTDFQKARENLLKTLREMKDRFESTGITAQDQYAPRRITTAQSPNNENQQSPTNTNVTHNTTPDDSI